MRIRGRGPDRRPVGHGASGLLDGRLGPVVTDARPGAWRRKTARRRRARRRVKAILVGVSVGSVAGGPTGPPAGARRSRLGMPALAAEGRRDVDIEEVE